MTQKKEGDVRILDLIARGAIEKEIETTKTYIRRIIDASDGDLWFLSDKDKWNSAFFHGFFTGALLIGAVNNVVDAMKRDSNIKDLDIKELAPILWYELEKFLEEWSSDYFRGLKDYSKELRRKKRADD